MLLLSCALWNDNFGGQNQKAASQKKSEQTLSKQSVEFSDKVKALDGLTKADRFKLIKVIDGDSLLILKAGKKTQVRLIGIDAPEISLTKKTLSDSKKSKLDIKTISKLGHRSKKHLSQILLNETEIKLLPGEVPYDHYGRMLAYVFTKDGLFINLKMLQDGYAKIYTVAPNDKFANQFRLAQENAKNSMLGLWATLN